jgi:hypothetical protein
VIQYRKSLQTKNLTGFFLALNYIIEHTMHKKLNKMQTWPLLFKKAGFTQIGNGWCCQRSNLQHHGW